MLKLNKNILTVVFATLFIFLLSASAQAFQFKLDFNALTAADKATLGSWATTFPYPTSDGETGLIERFGLAGASLINQNDDDGTVGLSVGDSFSETTMFYVDGFQPGLLDTEGLNLGYEITILTTGLSGFVTSLSDGPSGTTVVGYEFTPGSTFEMYLDAPPQFPQDPYNEVELADGTDPSSIDTSNYTGGIKIASATLVSGTGSTLLLPGGGATPDQDQGSVNLTYKFDFFYDDMFLDSTGKDFNDYDSLYYFLGLPAIDVDDTVVSAENNTTGSLFDAKVQNDGSAPITPIPEPTTMALFGIGLLGLAGVSRKRFD